MSATIETTAIIREMLMVREGEVVTMELAHERAANIVGWLIAEIGILAPNSSCHLNMGSGKAASSTIEGKR